jgi:hypothetical protein
MTMNNPLGRGDLFRIHAPLNLKLHKSRVPISSNRKSFLIQMACPFCKPSPDLGISKCPLVDDDDLKEC